jgi:hypothetical protein
MKRPSEEFNYLLSCLMRLQRSRQGQAGYVLFVTIGILLSMISLLGLYMKSAQVEKASATTSAASGTGFYGAEAGLNIRANSVQEKFLNFGLPSGTSPTNWTACANSSTSDDGSGDMACNYYNMVQTKANGNTSVTFGSGRGTASTAGGTVTNIVSYLVNQNSTNQDGTPVSTIVSIPTGEAFAGLNALEYAYTLYAAALNQQSTEELPKAVLQMDFKSRLIPIFQFGIFYDNDLELWPGPTMRFDGRIHSNGNIHLGAGDGLSVNAQITTAGTIYNSRKHDSGTNACGKVQVKDMSGVLQNLLSAFNSTCAETRSAISTTLSDSIFGDRIVTDISELSVPNVTDLNTTGTIYSRADLQLDYRPNTDLSLGNRAVVTVHKRNVSPVATSTLDVNQTRSLFQPVLAPTDACPVTLPTNTALVNGSRAAAANYLAAWANSSTSAITLTDIQNRLSNSSTDATATAPIWNSFANGTINNYLRQSVTTLSAASTNSATITVPTSTTTGLAASDIVAVGSEMTNIVSSTTSSAVTFTANVSTSTLPVGTVVAKVGRRISRTATNSILAITFPTITGQGQQSPSTYGWEVGDKLRITNGGPEIIRTITGIAVSSTTNNTWNITLDAATTTSGNSNVRLVDVGSNGKTPRNIVKVRNTSSNTITASNVLLSSGCFKASPLQVNSGFYNNREGRQMDLLQLSMEGLTLWNRDGVMAKSATNLATATVALAGATTDQVLRVDRQQFANMNVSVGDTIKIVAADNTSNTRSYVVTGTGTVGTGSTVQISIATALGVAVPVGSTIYLSTDQDLFDRDSGLTLSRNTDSNLPTNSYQRLGLSPIDTTNNGLGIHLTVNGTTYTSAAGNTSPYGFALTRGANLPGPISVISDQAVYVQGDYNCGIQVSGIGGRSCTTDDPLVSTDDPTAAQLAIKEPAAVMADSLNVVSNSCIDSNNLLNCGIQGQQPSGTDTTINSAFLAGNDVSTTNNYNGGLENYPRFHENWGDNKLTYRGSFVSLQIPLKVRGSWGAQVYDPPLRYWQYDSAFNAVSELPPLTPYVGYLKQELFSRDFSR